MEKILELHISGVFYVTDGAILEEDISGVFYVTDGAILEEDISGVFQVNETEILEEDISGIFLLSEYLEYVMPDMSGIFFVLSSRFFPSCQSNPENTPGTPSLEEYLAKMYPKVFIVCPSIDFIIQIPPKDLLFYYIKRTRNGSWMWAIKLNNFYHQYTKDTGDFADLITEDFYSEIRQTEKFIRMELFCECGDIWEKRTFGGLVIKSVVFPKGIGPVTLDVSGVDFFTYANEETVHRKPYIFKETLFKLSNLNCPKWSPETVYTLDDIVSPPDLGSSEIMKIDKTFSRYTKIENQSLGVF